MDEILAKLESIEGAKDVLAELRTALDGQKATLRDAEKRAKAAEKDAAKLKGDLESAGKGTDEASKAAQKERDEAKAEAEKARADLSSFRLRTQVERKLGIADETKAKRAVAALLEHAGESVSLDEKGDVVGFDKALGDFKKAEAFWFAPDAPGITTPRAGAGPNPAKPAGGSAAAPQTREEKIAKAKADMAARMPPQRGAKPASATH